MMWAWYVTYGQLMAGCCSQGSWEKGTDHHGTDIQWLSGQPVPSPPLTGWLCVDYNLTDTGEDTGVQMFISGVQRLENTSVCNSRDKSICMLFFSVLWQRNLGTTTEKSGHPRNVGVCRRRRRYHKLLSTSMRSHSRASSHCDAPALPVDHHFIPQAQH